MTTGTPRKMRGIHVLFEGGEGDDEDDDEDDDAEDDGDGQLEDE